MSRIRFGSLLAAAGILIVTGGCADSPSAPAAPGADLELLRAVEGPSFSRAGSDVQARVIGPEGGAIELSSGHTLTFPAGAVSAPTEIGMRADADYQGVRLSPHGLRFPASAQPVLTLRARGAASARADLRVVYVGEGNQILEVLPTTLEGGAATVSLEHFSGYILGGSRSEP